MPNADAETTIQSAVMLGTLVGTVEIEALFEQAARSVRRRSHLLLHAGPDDQVQRLLIAGWPDTYVRPHKHSVQWEMLLVLEGQLDVLTLDDSGCIRDRWALSRSAPVVQIPPGVWHTCVLRASPTLVLEVKPGPYRLNEFATWAPAEESTEAASLLSRMSAAQPNDRIVYVPPPDREDG